jgi:FMN phosphatase YigB (HAD superfamily)
MNKDIISLISSERSAYLYDIFDVVVESCVVKMRKPNKEIFDHALNLIQESRENLKNTTFVECIFLDDMGVNLKASSNLVCSYNNYNHQLSILEIFSHFYCYISLLY